MTMHSLAITLLAVVMFLSDKQLLALEDQDDHLSYQITCCYGSPAGLVEAVSARP